MTTQPTRTFDDDVTTYLELTEQIEELESQRAAVKARFIDRGVGQHASSSGVTVTVSAPSRRFNLDRAWAMLNSEQQSLCVSPDASKVKGQLPGALLDECMDEGTGSPRVSIR